MVKAPSKIVSPSITSNLQLQQQPYHQQLYQASPLFVKVQHLEMGNETPSTSTGAITNVSVIAVPTTSRMTSSAPVPALQYAPLHAPGSWPVDPVFHFGPGFEHIDISGGSARHYCPTHSQNPQPHEHVVFFHVNAGVSVTFQFQIAGNREVIRGEFFHFICIQF